MKTSSYMTRALQSRDRRFATVLRKLGHAAPEVAQAEPEAPESHAPVDELAVLRAEYSEAAGKRPFHGWDADTLREKIAAAKAAD